MPKFRDDGSREKRADEMFPSPAENALYQTPTVGRELPTPETEIPQKEIPHPGTFQMTPDQPEYWRERLKKLLKYTG